MQSVNCNVLVQKMCVFDYIECSGRTTTQHCGEQCSRINNTTGDIHCVHHTVHTICSSALSLTAQLSSSCSMAVHAQTVCTVHSSGNTLHRVS
jgi:hypothetical protein